MNFSIWHKHKYISYNYQRKISTVHGTAVPPEINFKCNNLLLFILCEKNITFNFRNLLLYDNYQHPCYCNPLNWVINTDNSSCWKKKSDYHQSMTTYKEEMWEQSKFQSSQTRLIQPSKNRADILPKYKEEKDGPG